MSKDKQPQSTSVYIRRHVNQTLLSAYSIDSQQPKKRQAPATNRLFGVSPGSKCAFGAYYQSLGSEGQNPYRDWGCTDSKVKFMVARDLSFKDREEYLRR